MSEAEFNEWYDWSILGIQTKRKPGTWVPKRETRKTDPPPAPQSRPDRRWRPGDNSPYGTSGRMAGSSIPASLIQKNRIERASALKTPRWTDEEIESSQKTGRDLPESPKISGRMSDNSIPDDLSPELKKRMQELISDATEPLNKELEAYIEFNDDIGMPIIRHPLLIWIGPLMPGIINKQYAQKLDSVARAIEGRDWVSYLYLHERPYRLDAFMDIADEMSDNHYWENLASIWIDSENIWQNQDTWVSAFSSDRSSSDSMMLQKELDELAALPNKITIYRGYKKGGNKNGLSWTTDKEKAEWFSTRLLRSGEKALVAKATVDKKDVVAYFTRRGESEIVLRKSPKISGSMNGPTPPTDDERKRADNIRRAAAKEKGEALAESMLDSMARMEGFVDWEHYAVSKQNETDLIFAERYAKGPGSLEINPDLTDGFHYRVNNPSGYFGIHKGAGMDIHHSTAGAVDFITYTDPKKHGILTPMTPDEWPSPETVQKDLDNWVKEYREDYDRNYGVSGSMNSNPNEKRNRLTLKGKRWKDKKASFFEPVLSFASQVRQYPKSGPSGVSYFKGEDARLIAKGWHVDALLFRDAKGEILGILNHYPQNMPAEIPGGPSERKGNVNIFINPKNKKSGIGTALLKEAVERFDVDLNRQRYSREGAAFVNSFVRSLPENDGKKDGFSISGKMTDEEILKKLKVPKYNKNKAPNFDDLFFLKEIVDDVTQLVEGIFSDPSNEDFVDTPYRDLTKFGEGNFRLELLERYQLGLKGLVQELDELSTPRVLNPADLPYWQQNNVPTQQAYVLKYDERFALNRAEKSWGIEEPRIDVLINLTQGKYRPLDSFAFKSWTDEEIKLAKDYLQSLSPLLSPQQINAYLGYAKRDGVDIIGESSLRRRVYDARRGIEKSMQRIIQLVDEISNTTDNYDDDNARNSPKRDSFSISGKMSNENILKKLEVPEYDENKPATFEDLPFYNQLVEDNERFIEEVLEDSPVELGYARAMQDSITEYVERLEELANPQVINRDRVPYRSMTMKDDEQLYLLKSDKEKAIRRAAKVYKIDDPRIDVLIDLQHGSFRNFGSSEKEYLESLSPPLSPKQIDKYQQYSHFEGMVIYDDKDLRRASHNTRIFIKERMKNLLELIDGVFENGKNSKVSYLFDRPELLNVPWFNAEFESAYQAESDRIEEEENEF